MLDHPHENHGIICMQKINYITHFSNILQRNSKVAILHYLSMPGRTQYQFKKTFETYLEAKNQLYPSRFPWDIAKTLQTCHFRYFGHALLHTLRVILSSCRNFCAYLQSKNQLHTPCFSGDIAKICKLILGTLGMPGYTLPKW